MTRALLFATLAVLSFAAGAQCRPSLPVSGVETARFCDPKTETCVNPLQAIMTYGEKVEGHDDPALISLFIHSSPWRFYDPDWRILTAEDLAAEIKPGITAEVKRVKLLASWSGVRPEAGTPSLAEQVGKALGGFEVTGADGFLWIAPDGKLRTTRQAATIARSGRYVIAEGSEVFVSLAGGWWAHQTAYYANQRDAESLLKAGVGWDIYMLCPDQALEAFEYAVLLGNPIAAYNAALMRLERNGPGDVEAATALLSKAAKVGDDPARKRLEALRSKGR